MSTYILDPWDSAEKAKEPIISNIIWGQCEAKAWFCVLERGIGKIEFDPQQHNPEMRRTAIDIIIHPLPEMDLRFDLVRNMIAESREWASFVLPSIRNLGLSPKEINGKWVKIQTVALTDKKGDPVTYTDTNGTVKEKTTIKFLATFKNEEECKADFLGKSAQYQGASGNGNNSTNGNKERETALAFLKVFVQNACIGKKDIETAINTLASQIAQQPIISKYFTVDSPETIQLINEWFVAKDR